MARSKYWGIPVAREVKEGVLINVRLDKMFVVTRYASGKETRLKVFHPGDILDEREKTLEQKFKKTIKQCTRAKEKIFLTPEVRNYLSRMETRMLKR